jgi:nicotinamide mononucleotide transporter
MAWKLFLQIVGVCLGLLYLLLEYRASIYLWVVGLIMPLVHGFLYYQSGLYADMGMNAYYVVAGLYGWLVWHNKPRKSGTSFPITRTPARLIAPLLAVAVVVFGAIWWVLARYTDSTVPVWDALSTALSVVAMWMLSRKYVEQWLVWLVVDMISSGLYIYKGIPFTAGLYALYSVLAVAGYVRWLKNLHSPPEMA